MIISIIFSIPFVILALLSCSLLPVVAQSSDPGSQSGPSSHLPTTARAFLSFARTILPFLPSSTRVELKCNKCKLDMELGPCDTACRKPETRWQSYARACRCIGCVKGLKHSLVDPGMLVYDHLSKNVGMCPIFQLWFMSSLFLLPDWSCGTFVDTTLDGNLRSVYISYLYPSSAYIPVQSGIICRIYIVCIL